MIKIGIEQLLPHEGGRGGPDADAGVGQVLHEGIALGDGLARTQHAGAAQRQRANPVEQREIEAEEHLVHEDRRRAQRQAVRDPAGKARHAFAADLHALRVARAAGREHDVGEVFLLQRCSLGLRGGKTRRLRVVAQAGAHQFADARDALGRVDDVDRHEGHAQSQATQHGHQKRRLLVAGNYQRRICVSAGLPRGVFPGVGGRAQRAPGRRPARVHDGDGVRARLRVGEVEGIEVETHGPALRWRRVRRGGVPR